MAGCVSVGAAQVEGRHVVMQEETVNLTDEMAEMIADLGIQYSNLTIAEEVGICDIEEQLKELEKKILRWDADKSMICLQDVTEVRELGEVLGLLYSSNKDEKHYELLKFAKSILQMAMEMLEDELVELLRQCCQPVEPDITSFHSAEDDSVDNFSSSSFDDESVGGISHGDTIRESENDVTSSIQHGLVSNIISIANLMFLSNYDKECCQAYVAVRKEALEEYLSVLQIDKFSISEVFKMEWKQLNHMINKWKQAMCAFIQDFLARERHLCNLVFGKLPRSARESCFVEISKSSILQLLGIAMAIAIAPPKPERLFQILNTYEVLNDLLVRMEHFFPEDYGSCVLTECDEVLLRLKESVSGTIEEFKNNIQSNRSSTAFAGGGVHHLTKYVMNYIKALSAYSETLGLILEDQQGADQSSSTEDGGRKTSLDQSPLSWHLKSLTTILETNLDHKSQLYNDVSLRNIFMMNNICYMVDKVKLSNLRSFFGDEWIRVHIRKFHVHEQKYERASWTSVLSFLRAEGLHKPGCSIPSLTVLKDRFRGFNHAFEEVYKAQTAWFVPNDGLREDLRISVSAQLIQAYRIFEGRYASHLDGERHRERYIKYSPDDLEEYLLDLFEGSPKSLQSQRRR
ncbi:exocyst complex component EXO70E2-like [Musa acuminata AAA Group]|uniref:exocyst complex component EXO70E2-like n=1 Tax=Musa acuminata AAA Group TaxID=214697 RepID=UPI0031DF8336